jgi:hypothetical protein
MTDDHPHQLGLLAKLLIAIAVSLFVSGVLWFGITLENVQRVWRNVIDRPNGALSFRFILQPSVAAFFAIRDGLRDARRNRSPFFWTIFWNPRERMGRLREGLNATAKIILLGILMDTVYQTLELRTFYPNEALIVALLLAFLPYVVARGLATRIAGRWRGNVTMNSSPGGMHDRHGRQSE